VNPKSLKRLGGQPISRLERELHFFSRGLKCCLVFSELRFDAYKVFNHAQFFNPVGDINASNFGQVVQAHDPRLIQLGAKFCF
jgi:hypothetical protein